MTKDQLLATISELKGALALIESDLATQVPQSEALGDFQTIVNSTRRSVWTVLKAMNTEDYQEYVAGFRLRRASETLKAVLQDFENGITPDARSAEALRDTLDSVVSTGPQPALSSVKAGRHE